eukprot:scaffold81317_cov75-Phaeocystis_antarctica.AAC.2
MAGVQKTRSLEPNTHTRRTRSLAESAKAPAGTPYYAGPASDACVATTHPAAAAPDHLGFQPPGSLGFGAHPIV